MLLLLACAAVMGRPAQAVPPIGSLQPARDYAVVNAVLISTANNRYTYKFTVENIQPAGGLGLKGLLVYSATQPLAISAPPRTSATLYHKRHQYSWWDINGGSDNDGNGLPDSFIEPGESVTDATYTLAYNREVTDFRFGVHVVQPFTGKTWFAHTNPATFSRVKITAAGPPCVRGGYPATFTYTIENTGTRLLNAVTVTDEFGTVAGAPASLTPGASAVLTRTVVLAEDAPSFTNGIDVAATDSVNGTNVSANTSLAVQVVHPALLLVKTASATTVLPGSIVTFSYEVSNPGDVAIKNIVVEDVLFGIIGEIACLEPGAVQTLSSGPIIVNSTIISDAYAMGFDACANAEVFSPDGVAPRVDVVNPQLLVNLTAGPAIACEGDTITLTYTVSNPSPVDITGVVVTFNDGATVNLGTIEAGTSRPSLVRTVTVAAGTPIGALAFQVSASGTATVGGTSVNVNSNTASASVQIIACAVIRGRVICAGNAGIGVAGASVQLIRDGSVVKTVTSDGNGYFNFGAAANGTYSVAVGAVASPDFQIGGQTSTPSSFAYDRLGSDKEAEIGLTPSPVTYRAVELLRGRVFFSNHPFFQGAATTGIVLTANDLLNPAFASPSFSVSYEYRGLIPGFAELGPFGDVSQGQPRVWVFMSEALLPEDRWNNYSFTNQVGVFDVIGSGATGTPGVYTYRILFNQPFDGPGTAYNYAASGVTFQGAQSTTPSSIAALSSVRTDGSPGTLNGSTIPAGWMARARFQFTLAPGVTTTVFVNGAYKNVCADEFTFSIHPDVGGGP